jgi:hypothetical protein
MRETHRVPQVPLGKNLITNRKLHFGYSAFKRAGVQGNGELVRLRPRISKIGNEDEERTKKSDTDGWDGGLVQINTFPVPSSLCEMLACSLPKPSVTRKLCHSLVSLSVAWEWILVWRKYGIRVRTRPDVLIVKALQTKHFVPAASGSHIAEVRSYRSSLASL